MSSSSDTRAFKRYITLAGLAWAGVYFLVFALNCLVDPLWYFQGNRLTDRNFAFNERLSKLNQLLRAPDQYDCLIFGSSRATLLPASAFEGFRCFNLSFSGGQVEDFLAFAEYLRHVGMRPRLIIVGVDGFNFQSSGRDAPNIPDFVLTKQPPAPFLKTYLSMDSLRMSLLTLRDKSPMPRYYDNRFEARIRADAPPFRPRKSLEAEGRRRADAQERATRGYRSDNARLYEKLVSLFPESRAIGYVPPISAWHISKMEMNGVLEGYMAAIYRSAQAFPVFIDFSAPSYITARTDVTYDGSHYHPSVNRQIAAALQSGAPSGWGLDPKRVLFTDYARDYQSALIAFRMDQAPTRPSSARHD